MFKIVIGRKYIVKRGSDYTYTNVAGCASDLQKEEIGRVVKVIAYDNDSECYYASSKNFKNHRMYYHFELIPLELKSVKIKGEEYV